MQARTQPNRRSPRGVIAGLFLALGCQQVHSSGVSRDHLDLAGRPTPGGSAPYARAVELARGAGPEAISRNLLALSPGQDGTWRDIDGRSHVLVATWTSYTGYPGPGEAHHEGDHEIWVTAVPQLRDFVRDYRPGDQQPTAGELSDRLEQLLGLPPHADHALVVEMWVPAERLFRPSADPEIADHEAQLHFPGVVAADPSLSAAYLAVSPAYRRWYEGQRRARYHPDEGVPYPWTRLGYTFDWGDPESPVGLSEFVVMSGTTVVIESKTATHAYGLMGRLQD